MKERPKELKPGEWREHEGELYKAELIAEMGNCDKCDLTKGWDSVCAPHWDILGECGAPFRSDGEYIVFKRIESQVVNVLTVLEPFASLIVYGPKDIENRSWEPWKHLVGKRLFIHSGLRLYMERNDIIYHYGQGVYEMCMRNRGHILGSVKLTGSVTESESPWFNGPQGWTLEEKRELAEPLPWKGAQGIWTARIPKELAI